MICIRTLILTACMLCVAVVSQAAVVVNDDFADGNLAANPGVGNGFANVSQSSGGNAYESGGLAVLSSSNSSGASRGIMISNDSVNAVKGATVMFDVQAHSGGLTRCVLGLVASSNGAPQDNSITSSMYIVLSGLNASGYTMSPGSTQQGNLVWVDSAGTRTTLASWDWTTYTGINASLDLQLTLAIDATSYALSLAGTDGGISGLTGSLTGSLSNNAAAAIKAFAFEQRPTTASSALSLDNVVVTQIPAPAALSAGLGLLALTAMRRQSRA